MLSGMSVGALLMGKILQKNSSVEAFRLYGLLEIIIGVAGFFTASAFGVLDTLDRVVYASIPFGIPLVYIVGIIAVCSISTLCMGATFPLFGIMSEKYQISLAKLYGLNTLGAAFGVLVVALVVIPYWGVTHTVWIISLINILVGFCAQFFVTKENISLLPKKSEDASSVSSRDIFIVFVTGFVTFTLEIAWFRSLLSVYPNTTDVFAIMLFCTLIALAVAAKKVPLLKQKKKSLGVQMSIAGICILLWTPLIERLDSYISYYKKMSVMVPHQMYGDFSSWFFYPDTFALNGFAILLYAVNLLIFLVWAYFIIFPAMRFLGVAFPWVIDNQHSSSSIGKLYAINTVAAVIGSIGAAWILLPTIGFAKTAWLAGILVIVAGISILSKKKRFIWIPLGILSLGIAIYFETGVGKTHVQGYYGTDEKGNSAKILGFFEGPDATVSAVEYSDGARALLINSILAAIEYRPGSHYMSWMGHLPMLLHPNPEKALVICFGTGQTANAVRNENPPHLDIVDINAHVFELGHFFRANQNVLNDPRVKSIVMDGRAYLRRTHETYDVITLEPLPPGSAGVNALYSKEFYQLARNKLSAHGVIAQWLPFHGVAPHYTASIAKTFLDVFPNAFLWLDPDSKTGILLGSKDDTPHLEMSWPGFARTLIKRDLSPEQIKNDIALNTKQLEQFAQYGEVVTDDNQLLAYGKVLYATGVIEENFVLLHRVNPRISLY